MILLRIIMFGLIIFFSCENETKPSKIDNTDKQIIWRVDVDYADTPFISPNFVLADSSV